MVTMNTDELVGQLVWAFISSAQDLTSVEQAVREGRVSGIWLLPTEMHSPGETAALIDRLQAVAPTPLLIGVDAEAGLGLVMGGATYLPTAMALGAAGDDQLAYDAAAVTAAEARACGINMVAGPVLDVNVNPANPIINTRAYWQRPRARRPPGRRVREGVAGRLASPMRSAGHRQAFSGAWRHGE